MTSEEIKKYSLDVLMIVHNFCVDNNIKYSIAYGTLIGAIRHKGFIPWDDDIDIIMPSEDYNRFIAEFKVDGYKVFAPELNNSFLAYGRVCEMRNTKHWTKYPWITEEAGIWIDIFPMDAVPSALCDWQDLWEKNKVLNNKLIKYRKSLMSPSRTLSLMENIKIMYRKLRYAFIDVSTLLKRKNYIHNLTQLSQTEYCGNLRFNGYAVSERIPKDWLTEYIFLPFEECEVMAVKEYDNLLRNYYGDYMKLPPIEKRCASHSHLQRFYIR